MNIARNQLISYLSVLILIGLVAVPLAGFAKEKERGKDKDKSPKVRVTSTAWADADEIKDKPMAGFQACMRALIQSRTVREPTVHGCLKMFGVGNATSTDNVLPLIKKIKIKRLGETEAEIRWKTNERTSGTLFFGTSTPVTQDGGIAGNKYFREHRVKLSGLTASTTYFAVIEARDIAGNVATSSPFSFITR